MRYLCRTLSSLCLLTTAVAAQAQTAPTYAELIARGDSLYDALRPADALEEYRAALLLSETYEAQWKFTRAQIDIAKQLEGDEYKKTRDSLYRVAHYYATGAILADSNGAEGYFMLANALGRLSRTRSGKERVRFGREIYNAAARAELLDPMHDGTQHVLGAWHAEIKRLSGLTKFFAKTFLGAGFMNRASWDSSVVHLERAIRLRPEYLFHRLELAEVYVDLKRFPDARRELEQVLQLPPTSDVSDPKYQAEAQQLLEQIRNR